MYPDLQRFIDALEQTGELLRISERVSPVLEITEIADRVSKAKSARPPCASARRSDPRHADRGGSALLFENVEGSGIPVLINAFGSSRRLEMAIGSEVESIAARIGELVKPAPPGSLREGLAMARRFAPLLKLGPKRSKKPGACQQVVHRGDDIDLTALPMLRCWPHDGDFAALGYPIGVNDGVPGLGHPGIDAERWEAEFRGRYITFAGVHTIHADDAGKAKPPSHNIGMYRVQLLGKDRLAMHWHVHHDGAAHWRSWKAKGEPMPVAIVLGGPSVLPYAATAPLPPGISELLMAGFLNRRGIRMCRGASVPLWVPADAEIVIEGFVRTDAGGVGFDPAEDDLGPGAVFEGPFGDHTGFYSLPDRYPIMEVSAITTRENPVFPATVVGLPPQEDYHLGKATERIFLPLLRTLIHDVEDYDLPMFGAFHNCAFVQIGKAYPLQARRVMHAVWGAGQMAWTKTVFVVDESVDVHDTFAVLRAAAEHCEPAWDLERVRGPLDILDHAAPWLGAGGKMGFDCTPKVDGERIGSPAVGRRSFSKRSEIEATVRGLDGVRDAAMPEQALGWLFVSTPEADEKSVRFLADAVLDAARTIGDEPAFVVFVGDRVDARNTDEALFHWVGNADMLRDAHADGRTVWFDSTPKTPGQRSGLPVREWPPLLEMDVTVRDRVNGLVGRLTRQEQGSQTRVQQTR